MKREFESNLQRLARRMLLVRAGETAAFCAIPAGLAGAGVVWAFSWFTTNNVGAISLVPLGAMLVAGITGAGWALFRGVSLVQAARFIDSRYALRDHISTGGELLGGEDTPVAACVFQKALADIKSLPVRINFWRRTRRTAFALLLTLAICGLLAIAVMATPRGVELGELSSVQRVGLEQAYRRAATSEQNLQHRNSLLAAADAIKTIDPERFEELTQQLRRQGLEISLQQVANSTAAGAGVGDDESAMKSPTSASSEDSAADLPPSHSAGEDPRELRVLVYDPGYFQSYTDGNGASESGSSPRAKLRDVPLQSAWASACQTANANLRTSSVPPEYRAIVRAFFANDDFEGKLP
ncbi:MAG: hypothetical protein KAR11_05940 [Phycisphaerae bacterium]|nr:hypothetical protein [Phycisphaerae bacterium]